MPMARINWWLSPYLVLMRLQRRPRAMPASNGDPDFIRRHVIKAAQGAFSRLAQRHGPGQSRRVMPAIALALYTSSSRTMPASCGSSMMSPAPGSQ